MDPEDDDPEDDDEEEEEPDEEVLCDWCGKAWPTDCECGF